MIRKDSLFPALNWKKMLNDSSLILRFYIIVKEVQIVYRLFLVGFPRDGMSQDKPGHFFQNILIHFVPGQKSFACPGTRAGANVQGRPGTK